MALVFESSHLGLELVDLSAGACLPAIKRARVQKKGTPHLIAVEIDAACRDQHSDSPIEAKNRAHLLESRLLLNRNLDDEIEHGVARAIWLDDFSQVGSLHLSRLGAGDDDLRKCHLNGVLAPVACPFPCLVGGSQGERERFCVQIKAEAIGLAFGGTVVACVRQDACFEDGDALHLFVGVRETAVGEVEGTGLLDEDFEVNPIAPIGCRIPQLLQRLSNGFPVFAPALVFTFRDDHALFKQGKDQDKLLFALSLAAKNAACLLSLTTPLAMSMHKWRRDNFFDLFVAE